MPRRVAIQVGQLVSRHLQGGLLKRPPVAYETLLSHPPTPLPSRAPHQRPALDTPVPRQSPWNTITDASAGEDAALDAAAAGTSSPSRLTHRSNRPKLGPQPIVYLEDRVRERFYNDHPWETLQPRTLVEGRQLSEVRVPPLEATDLTAWGRNPGPEDVIACVMHLHRNHGLSLSQAYHHTLSSYYALRAEHEHATRMAAYEARSYGATFGKLIPGSSSSSSSGSMQEVDRGFQKEAQELRKGARYLAKTIGGPAAAALFAQSSTAGGAGTQGGSLRRNRHRVKNTWAPLSNGEKYLQAALAARDAAGSAGRLSSSVASSTQQSPPKQVTDVGTQRPQRREGHEPSVEVAEEREPVRPSLVRPGSGGRD